MFRNKFNLRKVVAVAICLAGMTTMTAQNADIYSAGGGKIWKNNVELYSVANGSFKCIYVLGNDIYTGGTVSDGSYSKAAIWKNGTLLYQLSTANYNSYVNSVSVSGGNVYACGDDSYDAVVWKNGTKLYTLAQGSYNQGGSTIQYAYANSMQIVNNDVYVVGYVGSSLGNKVGKVWKNGTLLYNIGETTETHYLYDIAVSGNDVYVTGTGTWKNGTLYSDNGIFSSISVLENDVYVAGYTPNGVSSNKFAKVWKNGAVLYQITDGTTDARGNDICVVGNDVYALTRTFAYPNQNIIWKNGVELYNMGSQSVEAICLSSNSSSAIANIEIHNLQIYPNPVKDELFIQCETDIDRIEIYDIAGKQMFTSNLTNTKSISVSVLPAGIYVLKIGNYSEKFVKE